MFDTITNHYYGCDAETNSLLKTIIKNQNKMALSQAEAAAELVRIKDQILKSRAEILAKIEALEIAQQNAGNVTPEVEAAMAELKDAAQATDDIVPDAPVEPAP